jgi:hypothetical protein
MRRVAVQERLSAKSETPLQQGPRKHANPSDPF